MKLIECVLYAIYEVSRNHENEAWDSELKLMSEIKTTFDIWLLNDRKW